MEDRRVASPAGRVEVLAADCRGIKFHSRMIQASQEMRVFDEWLCRRTMSSKRLLNKKSRVMICLRVILLPVL